MKLAKLKAEEPKEVNESEDKKTIKRSMKDDKIL